MNNKITVNECVSNNFEFTLDINDTIFVLTQNNSLYKEGIKNIVRKMFIVRELKYVNLDDLSRVLKIVRIEKLNIFSIDCKMERTINHTSVDKGSKVKYIEMSRESFIKNLNNENGNFL